MALDPHSRWTCFQIEAEVDQFGEGRIVAAHNALLADWERRGEALAQAAMSLETIADSACKRDGELAHAGDVRGYAGSRARAAREALGGKP